MNLGITEIFFLVVIGLLVFGPKKLPQIGRELGKILGEFKRASQDFQVQLDNEVRTLELDDIGKQSIAPPAGATARGTVEPVSPVPPVAPVPPAGNDEGSAS